MKQCVLAYFLELVSAEIVACADCSMNSLEASRVHVLFEKSEMFRGFTEITEFLFRLTILID